MEVKEYEVRLALENIENKIANFIKNNKESDFKKFQENLNSLIADKELIYKLDENTINKYLEGGNNRG